MDLSKWIEVALNLIQIIVWPFVIIIVLFSLRKPIISFISHINEAELPGGIILKSIPKEIEKAENIKERVSEESNKSKPDLVKSKIDANEEMKKHGLELSPSNLKIEYYYDLVEKNPNLALVGLRIDLEIMIRNLAKGFHLYQISNQPTQPLIEKLLNRGAITTNQFKLMKIILNICNAAAHGQEITKAQAIEVLEIAPVLISDYISWLKWGFKNT
jgi:hypothetical protein